MTEQEKQERLDAVRDFLERNDGRPFILAGGAWLGNEKIDGMRLSDGIETVSEAKGLLTGMMLIVIGPTVGTAEQRQNILTKIYLEAMAALEEEQEDAGE